ncbi:TonB-dependent receptor plug domain-containing protein [Undibacterium sp. TJN19]|uniref:TonB-dependent receptor plug domain-containing protein n=1 Tax=Undibacterium sp. TJN19 TaxID=3413055 RepID=UPI003BF3B0E9
MIATKKLQRQQLMKCFHTDQGSLATDINKRSIKIHCNTALLLFSVCAVCTITATAQENDAKVYISATALPVTAAAATQDVTMIGREELAAMGDISVSEVLARQTGIVVDRSPRSGGFGSLFLRGADPSHVVILVDYIRQNDPLSSRGSAVDLNTLTTADIERIEIVRGNASVVHAEAIAGLIHIFTRRTPNQGSISLGAGGNHLRSAQASYAGNNFSGSISDREEGDSTLGFNRTRSVNGAWQQSLERNGYVSLTARHNDSLNLAFPDDSGGELYAVRRNLESRRADSTQASGRLAINTEQMGRVEMQLSTLKRNGEENTPGVASGKRDPAGLPAIRTLTDYQRHELQGLWLLSVSQEMQVTLGLQHQREQGSMDSLINFGRFSLPAKFELQRNTSSVFGEANYQWGLWTAQAGLRYEIVEHGDTFTNPAFSLKRRIADTQAHWGFSFSQGSKQPSFYALGHPLVGNPDLRSERTTQREIYYASDERSSWPTRISIFSASYPDLIDFDAGPPPRLLNRAKIEAQGVEWRTRHNFGNDWRLQLEGTMMRVRDQDGIASLRFRPENQLGAQLSIPLGERRDLSIHSSYLSRRLDSSIPTGDRWLDARHTVDVSLRMPAGNKAWLNFAIDNVFNNRAEESMGTPMAARRLRAAINWTL